MRTRAVLFTLVLVGGAGCVGELGGDGGDGSGESVRGRSSASCGELAAVSALELASLKNAAYFEASYLPAHRSDECAKVVGTILGRASAGGYGSGIQGVISAPYQFEVYDAIRICAGGSCLRLTDGLGVDGADTIRRYGSSESAAAHLAGYQQCAAVVEATLRSTPGTIYLNFHADGAGTNSFSNARSFPAGCDLLGGGQPAPAEPAPAPGEPASPTPTEDGLTSHLHGTVTVAGAPTAGLQVSAWGQDEGDSHVTTTDAGGIYAFGDLRPGSLYNVVVNASFNADVEGSWQRVDEASTFEVRDNVRLEAGPDGWHGEDFSLDR